jgi:RND family efflux transporter MFP subunit
MKKWVGIAGGVVIVSLLLGGAWLRWGSVTAQGGSSASSAAMAASGAAGGAKQPQAVTLYTVLAKDLPLELEATGNIVALKTVEIRPQTTATVRRVGIREGQFVRQGDLLFSFDDRQDQANLARAQATLLRDQATLADLQRQWTRAQDLRLQNFISQSAADTVLSQWEAQKALVASSEAGVRAAEVTLSLDVLRAPFAGRTGAVAVNEGSLVQPTGNPLVTISQIDPIGVSFQVPEDQVAALLAHGTSAVQGLPLTVLRASSGSEPAWRQAGSLRFVDNAVDSSSGTIKLKGELPNPKQQVWPGQFVSVRLTLSTLKAATVVPQAALILRGQERQVYVVDAAGLAQIRPVILRQNTGDWAAVDGLQPGEKVVLDGKQNLRPGTPVKEAMPKAAKPSLPSSGAAAASRSSP